MASAIAARWPDPATWTDAFQPSPADRRDVLTQICGDANTP
jgi:hypothetical protein